jgi:hypothetical protein
LNASVEHVSFAGTVVLLSWGRLLRLSVCLCGSRGMFGGCFCYALCPPPLCCVCVRALAAHADFKATSAFIESLRPPHIVLVHGEKNQMRRLHSVSSQPFLILHLLRAFLCLCCELSFGFDRPPVSTIMKHRSMNAASLVVGQLSCGFNVCACVFVTALTCELCVAVLRVAPCWCVQSEGWLHCVNACQRPRQRRED